MNSKEELIINAGTFIKGNLIIYIFYLDEIKKKERKKDIIIINIPI